MVADFGSLSNEMHSGTGHSTHFTRVVLLVEQAIGLDHGETWRPDPPERPARVEAMVGPLCMVECKQESLSSQKLAPPCTAVLSGKGVLGQ